MIFSCISYFNKFTKMSRKETTKSSRKKAKNYNDSVSSNYTTSASTASSSSSSSSIPVIRGSVKEIQDESKAESTNYKYVGSFKRFHKWLGIHHSHLILEALPIGDDSKSLSNWNWKGINWELVEWDTVMTDYLEHITFNERSQALFKSGLHIYMYIYIYIYSYTYVHAYLFQHFLSNNNIQIFNNLH
jgi:hypothetical protein